MIVFPPPLPLFRLQREISGAPCLQRTQVFSSCSAILAKMHSYRLGVIFSLSDANVQFCKAVNRIFAYLITAHYGYIAIFLKRWRYT